MALKALKGYMQYRHERLGRPDKYMIRDGRGVCGTHRDRWLWKFQECVYALFVGSVFSNKYSGGASCRSL